MTLNQFFVVIEDQIYDQIIVKAEKHENPRDCDFTDINADGKKASISKKQYCYIISNKNKSLILTKHLSSVDFLDSCGSQLKQLTVS